MHEKQTTLWPKVIDLTKFIDTMLMFQLQKKLDEYIKTNEKVQVAYILMTIKQRKFIQKLDLNKDKVTFRVGNGVDEPDLLFGIPCSYIFKQKRRT